MTSRSTLRFAGTLLLESLPLSLSAPWVEALVDRGITAGCGGGNYCPDSVNTRGQMSVFISTTFQLP